MPKLEHIKKVLVIGSGPIIIGQAAEFDYAGTQACKALREEGVEVVLINSNPATIMTDKDTADAVYIEPITLDVVTSIIERERPDGLLGALGGQTGLNMTVALHDAGVLMKYNVALLGTGIDSIKKAEDRELFKNLMEEIGEPVAKGLIVNNIEDGVKFAEAAGYPIIIRPAYTLGGTGGGIAGNREEFEAILKGGLAASPICQALVERSVAGWKEVEYEVMRDGNDTCIVICNMENIDPVGVHTGDSIVAAPSQTLSADECAMLKASALKIIRALGIKGGCNIQFALEPNTMEYVVIEVNPRVSRSSALASKATGFPIAKVAAKIAVGLHLHEIENTAAPSTTYAFEPALDYVVIKVPKFPFNKFPYADKTLGTQMKATGEVMSIDRRFESALQKGVVSYEGKDKGLRREELAHLTKAELLESLKVCGDDRIFRVTEAFRKGAAMQEIHDLTKIDYWFLDKIKGIVDLENELRKGELPMKLLLQAEELGFTDSEITELSGKPFYMLDAIRRAHNIYSVYKSVDTCAGEYPSENRYYYSTFEKEDDNYVSPKQKVIVIGSGPIQIGQGIEFDYCSVHAAKAIQKAGYESIIINNNPETVSTDFDTADKLYFEPLYIEDVVNVIRKEVPRGVIVQFGGQTSINLTKGLHERGVQILGTSMDSVDVAEDRERFEILLNELNIPHPRGYAVPNLSEAREAAEKIGYPVLVRPSYVIGGRAMEIVHNRAEMENYFAEAVPAGAQSILVDKYVGGKEVEVDAISDGEHILIPGVIEHIERAGVHSGDSITVYPPISLSGGVMDKLVTYTEKIARAVKVKGLMNIQFVVDGEDVYVIEVNPRASRTVPILSKVTDVPMVDLAVRIILGEFLNGLGYGRGLLAPKKLFAVKAPIFSFAKLTDADPALGPEMKSTGEVLGIDRDYKKAMYKAFKAAGFSFPTEGRVLLSIRENERSGALAICEKLKANGYSFHGTAGTAGYFSRAGLSVTAVSDIDSIIKDLGDGKYAMVINIPTRGKDKTMDGFKIRAAAIKHKIPLFTCADTAACFAGILTECKNPQFEASVRYLPMSEY